MSFVIIFTATSRQLLLWSGFLPITVKNIRGKPIGSAACSYFIDIGVKRTFSKVPHSSNALYMDSIPCILVFKF